MDRLTQQLQTSTAIYANGGVDNFLREGWNATKIMNE